MVNKVKQRLSAVSVSVEPQAGTDAATLPSSGSQASLVRDRKETVSLQRELTLLHALAYVVGTIIGSGIFVSPKGILQQAESVGATLVIWVATGLVAMLGALSFSELALTIPKAGGQYIYFKEMYGDVVAFFGLWTKMFIQGPAARAIQALTFAAYAVEPFYEEHCDEEVVAEKLLAVSVLLLLVFLNCRGTKIGALFQVLSTAGKVIALIIIIVVGMIYLFRGDVGSFENAFDGTPTDISALTLAFYPGLYAYSGYTVIIFGLTEIKNPARTVPLAIIGGLTLTIALYLLTNVAYLAVITPREMLEVDAVALTFGSKTLGVMYWIFSVFVCISVAGTLNSTIFSSGRLYHAGAKEGQMFPALAMLHVDYLTPIPAIVFAGTIALIYLLVGDIYALINTLGFVSSTENFLLISGLVYWRYKKPDVKRPVKYPVIIHFLFAISCLFLLALPIYSRPVESAIGVGIMCTSLLVYFLFLYRPMQQRLPNILHGLHRRLTHLLQKLANVIYEEEYVEQEEDDEKPAPPVDFHLHDSYAADRANSCTDTGTADKALEITDEFTKF